MQFTLLECSLWLQVEGRQLENYCNNWWWAVIGTWIKMEAGWWKADPIGFGGRLDIGVKEGRSFQVTGWLEIMVMPLRMEGWEAGSWRKLKSSFLNMNLRWLWASNFRWQFEIWAQERGSGWIFGFGGQFLKIKQDSINKITQGCCLLLSR